MAIKIITDSMCDVPKSYIEECDILVVPLTVHFGGQIYKDGIDIKPIEFYNMLEKEAQLPKTSQVSPVEFMKVFKEELDKGNELIVINASSALSGTHNSALLAKNQIESQLIHVVDTQGITLGAGTLVIKAARLAKQGMLAEDILKEIEESKERLKHYFVLDTLKYLHKGGRISLSASVLGSILNIKPILTVESGKMVLMEKSRGTKKAIFSLIEMIKENGWSLDGKVIGINHSNAQDLADVAEDLLRKEFNIKEVIRGEVGSVVAAYAGPGAVAFYFEV